MACSSRSSPSTFRRGYPHSDRAALRISFDAGLDLEPIDLVVDEHLRNLVRTDFREHAIDLRDVLVAPRIARIHHVQQQRGFARLGKGGLERGHQLVRQLANETDRVGNDDRRAAGQRDATHRGIQRCEELVRDVCIGARDRAKQRGLARVRVADERNGRHGNLALAARGPSRAAA